MENSTDGLEKEHNDSAFDKQDVLKSSSSNDRFRWNLMFNLLIWSVIPLPLWLPVILPLVAFYLLPSLQIFFALSWFVVNVSAWKTYWKLLCWKSSNEEEENTTTEIPAPATVSAATESCNDNVSTSSRSSRLTSKHNSAGVLPLYTNPPSQPLHTLMPVDTPPHHLIVISAYKEPLSLLAETISTLAAQRVKPSSSSPSSSSMIDLPVTLTVSFEERTPHVEDKIRSLRQKFRNKFRRIIFTIHPFGVEGEIPGKCSNANYGIRESLKYLEEEGIAHGINDTVTKDTDEEEEDQKEVEKNEEGYEGSENKGYINDKENNLMEDFDGDSNGIINPDRAPLSTIIVNNLAKTSPPHDFLMNTTHMAASRDILITTCDADTKFHPFFLHALTMSFLSETGACRYNAIFQSPLLYNWKLDEASVITRVTGIVRSALMMGALIPFNINGMSVFSFSSHLAIAGDFVHPAYQMDDIIALIRWMGVTGRRLRLVLVPVPTLSGPTSGRVLEEEIKEWAIQVRRWTIGAAEVFHYFVVKAGKMSPGAAITWGAAFLFYYAVLLCCSHLYGVVCGISYAIFDENYAPGATINSRSLLICNVLAIYFNSLLMFLLDWKAPHLLEPRPKEQISFARNCFHFAVSPLVIAAYSLVEFLALNELALRGKQVCSHRPSKKVDLV